MYQTYVKFVLFKPVIYAILFFLSALVHLMLQFLTYPYAVFYKDTKNILPLRQRNVQRPMFQGMFQDHSPLNINQRRQRVISSEHKKMLTIILLL